MGTDTFDFDLEDFETNGEDTINLEDNNIDVNGTNEIIDSEPIIISETTKDKEESKVDIQKGKGKKKDKKNKQDEAENIPVTEEKKDMALYVVTDKPLPGLLAYFRSIKLNVTAVFSSIEDARGYLMMQSIPTRVVVVDTGSGRFMTTTIRKDLIDMIGMGDEDTKFTVFYTDTLLKSDAQYTLGKISKQINWIPYKNTVVLAAIMLTQNENYIIDESYTDYSSGSTEENILAYVGQPFMDYKDDKLGKPIINYESIYANVVETTAESIMGFEPKI